MANWSEAFGDYADVDWPNYFQNMIQSKQGQGGGMAGMFQGAQGGQAPQGGQMPQGGQPPQGYQGYLPEGMPNPQQAVQQADQFMQMIPQMQQMMPQQFMPQGQQQMMPQGQQQFQPQVQPQVQAQEQYQYQPQEEIQFMAPPVQQEGRIDQPLVAQQGAEQSAAELQATIAEGGGGQGGGGQGGGDGKCPDGQEMTDGVCTDTAETTFDTWDQQDRYYKQAYPEANYRQRMQLGVGMNPSKVFSDQNLGASSGSQGFGLGGPQGG